MSVQEGSRDVGGGTDIDEGTDYDRFVTVDGDKIDDEGEGDQAPIEVGEVKRVGGVVEVAGVKWKRVENVTRDVSVKCQNYTEQYNGAAAHTVTTRLQVHKGQMQVEDGDYERRRETSSSFVVLHSNPCIIICYKY